jgi:hypothetical protein
MYYAIEIGSSLFLSGSLGVFRGCLPDVSFLAFQGVLDVELSYLFIVGDVTPRVSKPHDYANHMFMRL